MNANFNGVSLHWKYQALRKGNARHIHAGRIPSSQNPRGGIIAGGYRGHTIARNSARRARTLLHGASGTDHHEITFRIQRSGYRQYTRIWYTPRLVPRKHTSGNLCMSMLEACPCFRSVSGDSEAGVPGTPLGSGASWSCAPPHFLALTPFKEAKPAYFPPAPPSRYPTSSGVPSGGRTPPGTPRPS